MLRFLVCPALMLAACHGDSDQPQVPETCTLDAGPAVYKPVRIWVQDDPDLGMPEAVNGCDLWQPKCLQGGIVTTESEAAAKIYASHIACVRDDTSGGYVLAVSAPGGKIVVFVECMRKLFTLEKDGHISRLMLKLVLAHELGHEAGMWFHVPASCDGTKAKNDFEKDLVMQGICGKALMNAFINSDVKAITELDSQAYDQRDSSSSTFPHFNEMPDGCVLTYLPPL